MCSNCPSFRFPLDPPKGGKGSKLSEASGVSASARMPVLVLLEAAKERYTRNHSSSESTTPRMSGEGTGGTIHPHTSATGLDYSTILTRDQQSQLPVAVLAAQRLSNHNPRQGRLGRLLSIKEVPNDIHQPQSTPRESTSTQRAQHPSDMNGLGF